jgi:hypothetical protein
MQDAGFFRARAEQCLRLANAVGDTLTTTRLQVLAAEYHARAVEAESQTEGNQSTTGALTAKGS